MNANDVRVTEQSGLLYFTNEITEGDGVVGKLGREALDGNGLLQVLILSQPDDSATASPQLLPLSRAAAEQGVQLSGERSRSASSAAASAPEPLAKSSTRARGWKRITLAMPKLWRTCRTMTSGSFREITLMR